MYIGPWKVLQRSPWQGLPLLWHFPRGQDRHPLQRHLQGRRKPRLKIHPRRWQPRGQVRRQGPRPHLHPGLVHLERAPHPNRAREPDRQGPQARHHHHPPPREELKVGASRRRLQAARPSFPRRSRRLQGSYNPPPQWAHSLSPFTHSILSTQGPTFTADTVLGRDGFLVGAEASYNVTEGRVTKYSAAVGFSAPEYAVTLHGLSNFSTFAASYYHRVSPDVEAGAKAVYDAKATAPGVALEVGTKA